MTPRARALLPQRTAIIGAVLLLAALPTSWLEHGPSLCLLSAVFGSCPFCGSVRALSHFFHGHFREALGWNLNVIIAGPLLLWLALDSVCRLARTLSRMSAGTQRLAAL